MEYRVVIIDDEAWTRDTIRRIGHWHEFGFQIVGEAADGVSGLECVRQLRPHLIITDMKMPGIDGSQLLRAMEENDIHAKVIVVSGYYDYEYARQALNSRVADYLLKPINEEEFNSRLCTCAEELKKEDHGALSAEGILVGNVESEWLKGYLECREGFSRSFDNSSEKGVHSTLEKLEKLFYSLKDDDTRLKMLIKANYDIQSLLEETIIAKYGEDCEHLPLNDISFTIHENSTVRDLAEHYRQVTSKIILAVTAQQQSKKRIDIPLICEFLNTHYTQSITLEEMAKRFFVSKEYLSSSFKKEVGVNFTEYLTSVRMQKAKEMILEYGIPIQKVSEMVGYADLAYFYKTFKRYFGSTPAKMREELK